MKRKEKYFKLIDKFYSNLEKFALNMTRNREKAKDLISETIVQSFDGYKRLRSDDAFLSFLFTICSRIYYSDLRKQNVTKIEEPDSLFSNSISPEDKTDITILQESIDELPDIQKEILILYEIIGFKYKEIAEIKNISIDNVKVILHRARKNLKEMLLVSEKINSIRK
jgi:RNA polymerase sigma-70 factor (ECF subfamily)